jgi:hypothetical protein
MTGLDAPRSDWKARVDSTFPAPTSSSAGVDSSASNVLIPSAKRTVSRACCAQYFVEVASDCVIQVPVTHETYGNVGGESWTSFRRCLSGSMIGSTIDEWNACDVCKRLHTTLRA